MTELTPTKIDRMLLGHGTLSDMTIETIWTSVKREKELKLEVGNIKQSHYNGNKTSMNTYNTTYVSISSSSMSNELIFFFRMIAFSSLLILQR